MVEGIDGIVQVEDGPRFVQQGMYKGQMIQVVAGYSVTHDCWPFHVFVIVPGKRDRRLTNRPTSRNAPTLEDAFNAGFECGKDAFAPAGSPSNY